MADARRWCGWCSAGGDLDGLRDARRHRRLRQRRLPAGRARRTARCSTRRAVRETHPKERWPARRRYTVRAWDAAARLLTLDFVVHGDEGVAGPWAAAAGARRRPRLRRARAAATAPTPPADWHLMVGDESALPAIAASLEALPRRRAGRRPARLRRPRARGRRWPARRRRRAVAAPHRRGRRRRPAGRRGRATSTFPRGRACTRSCTARPTRSAPYAATCCTTAA